MHVHGVVAPTTRGVAVALKRSKKARAFNARQQGWVANLKAIKVQDWQDGAIGLGVDEFVGVPGRGERAGFCPRHHQPRRQQSGPGCQKLRRERRDRVASSPPLMNRAGNLGADMAG